MNHHDELDQEIASLRGPSGFSRADATVFWHALHKIAAQGAPAPDADLAQQEVAVATGQEASPQEAAAHTQAAVPDESGHLEGEFAVPVEQVVMTLSQLVSNSMRQDVAYAFYGEMMRDLGRGELAELFDQQSRGEREEMKYFLRRMSVLQPGGVPIPVAPTPPPSSDPVAALQYLIAGEQQAIVLFKTLHSMLGENPMKYTMEQKMQDAQDHLDRLWQYMPATEAPTQTQANAAKVASVISKMASPQMPSPQPGDVPVGAPGTEPLSAILGRENMLQQAQLMGENQDLRMRMDQASQQALMTQQRMESVAAENENLQMQAMQASDQAQMATEQAQLSSEQAAAQADAKMRLAIRINQFRQTLADIASADPVGEEGLSFGEQAGAGSVMTSSQQSQMAQEMAAMDPTGGMGGAPGAEAAQQQGEAANAQQDAAKQTVQAQEQTKADSAKKETKSGTTVSVKTSALDQEAVEFYDHKKTSGLLAAVEAAHGRPFGEKGASVLSTLAMDVGSQAKHLARMGSHASKAQGIPKAVVAARNAEMKAFTPRPMPQAAPAGSAAPLAATKKTPTQAIDRLAVPRHLAKTNPQQAIQAGRQYGAPVMGSASVLDQLSQTSFDKLSKRKS